MSVDEDASNVYNNDKNKTNTTIISISRKRGKDRKFDKISGSLLLKRIVQLERLVSSQAVELRRLKTECQELREYSKTFAEVVELLREAGLSSSTADTSSPQKKRNENYGAKKGETVTSESKVYEYLDEEEIFGSAPSSVTDAADSAGSAILAAMLAGKQRMLVDVRDAELSRDAETLVQFIELAILPVAAGLEGLKSLRNRVKIVFPTVAQLLEYRKNMALAAPEVVALSTLELSSVEEKDNLVVIIAPNPDDEEGMAHLKKLLKPTNLEDTVRQPMCLINYHMMPLPLMEVSFETVYHLRLLSVQYMSGDMHSLSCPPDFEDAAPNISKEEKEELQLPSMLSSADKNITLDPEKSLQNRTLSQTDEDAAVEAAVERAQQVGVNQGITRAMVIRSYPREWHVFVDISPDIDADFEVAATFDQEPSQDEINYAIIECLQGSEREDELVAQQMQEALEAGQLTRLSDLLGDIDDEYDEDIEDLNNEESC